MKNPDFKVMSLDFDTPEFREWNPADSLDCDVWATAGIGNERGTALFQIHICTAAAMRRIDDKRHCFVIDEYPGVAKLIAHLDEFIDEKTKGCTGDPYRLLAQVWRHEYAKYDARGQLID
jgi:hypothetical protein